METQPIKEDKSRQAIIKHNFFKWALVLILLAFIIPYLATEEETVAFAVIISKVGYIVVTAYYWYQLRNNYWGILISLISLLPLGFWAVLIIMAVQINKHWQVQPKIKGDKP